MQQDDRIEDLASRHRFSPEAVRVLAQAMLQGGGRQAQFSHPELGGMGQWSAAGMLQIGTMFDEALKARVAALCRDLVSLPPDSVPAPTPPAGAWWPPHLGQPSASGGQNGMRYACFPEARRVAVEQGGRTTLYDSGPHRIAGVAQAQSGTQDLVFTSQLGSVRAADLPVAE